MTPSASLHVVADRDAHVDASEGRIDTLFRASSQAPPGCAPTCSWTQRAGRRVPRHPQKSGQNRLRVAIEVGGRAPSVHQRGETLRTDVMTINRLWALADDTICLLVERDQAPRFEISVLRGQDVVRQDHLYARGTAEMMAETWRTSFTQAHSHRSAVSGRLVTSD